MAEKRTAVMGTSIGDLAPLVSSFVRHLRAGNKAQQTITAYTYAANGLAEFLAERGMPTSVAAIKRENSESYLEDLLTRRSASTAHNRHRGLQAFFKRAFEEGEIPNSPWQTCALQSFPSSRPAWSRCRTSASSSPHATRHSRGEGTKRSSASSSTPGPGCPRLQTCGSIRRTAATLIWTAASCGSWARAGGSESSRSGTRA